MKMRNMDKHYLLKLLDLFTWESDRINFGTAVIHSTHDVIRRLSAIKTQGPAREGYRRAN
jgi:hypothetical protein